MKKSFTLLIIMATSILSLSALNSCSKAEMQLSGKSNKRIKLMRVEQFWNYGSEEQSITLDYSFEYDSFGRISSLCHEKGDVSERITLRRQSGHDLFTLSESSRDGDSCVASWDVYYFDGHPSISHYRYRNGFWTQQYYYDNQGRLVRLMEGDEEWTFTWNEKSILTVTRPKWSGSGCETETIRFEYPGNPIKDELGISQYLMFSDWGVMYEYSLAKMFLDVLRSENLPSAIHYDSRTVNLSYAEGSRGEIICSSGGRDIHTTTFIVEER